MTQEEQIRLYRLMEKLNWFFHQDAGILCCGGGHPAYQWGRRASSSCGLLQLKSRPR